MPRYTPGTRPEYTPIDYDRALRRVRLLNLAPTSRALQVAQELVRHCRSEHTAYSYGGEIASFLGWCKRAAVDPLKATPIDIDAYIAHNARYAIGTQHLKLLVARLFYKRVIARHYLRDNPVVIPHSIRRVPETATPSLSKSQAEALLLSISAEFGDARVGLSARRDYALVMLLIRLCLRSTEAGHLRWGRFSESGGRRGAHWMAKGSKPNGAKVPDDVWDILHGWKHAYEAATGTTLGPGDPLFPGVGPTDLKLARGRSGASPLPTLSRTCIYRIIHARLLDIGLRGERFGPHCLRATGAVLAFQGGADILEIKELLGHSSVDTTIRYLQRLLGGAADRAVDRIHLDVPAWDDEADAAPGLPDGEDAAPEDARDTARMRTRIPGKEPTARGHRVSASPNHVVVPSETRRPPGRSTGVIAAPAAVACASGTSPRSRARAGFRR